MTGVRMPRGRSLYASVRQRRRELESRGQSRPPIIAANYLRLRELLTDNVGFQPKEILAAQKSPVATQIPMDSDGCIKTSEGS